MSTTTIVILVLLALLLVWAVATYNRFIALRNEVKNAYAQIDVQLKRRYDLIPNLVEVARAYMQHERETLQAVTEARNQAISAARQARAHAGDGSALQALAGAEAVLGAGLGRLMAVAEGYPELKADGEMRRLSEEIASSENRIGFARQAYNDTVLAYNNATQSFPSNLIASLARFASLPMLESTSSEQERQAPKVRF
ncbi:LemA family protein [Vandammella animalimorsus]|uniref:LemA family protein n=1 Tax=Vandammella animalimorsus TaxID=2029117 RepID=A0A3M6RRC3_9BURK|nr:LemA family protein [Vandammella animalimorsus]RMX17495.1 LemA family protein [Vandammella animalimorsus]